jgi:uncharacterized protein (TIGR04255 family)
MNQAPTKYSDPPIQEAICEIHFVLPSPLDREGISRIQPHWRQVYPAQEIVAERTFQLHLSVDRMQTDSRDTGHKLIARSEDRQRLAQLGPSFLAVNRLRPYVGWEEEFRDTILARFGEIQAEYGFQSVQRIGLRYINKIDLPDTSPRWGNWFKVALPVPSHLGAQGGVFQTHFRHALNEQTECILNFGTLVPSPPGVASVMLDIDVVWQGQIGASDLASKLEAVHDPHRDLFEAYLLDSTRNLFNLS